jgi:hypothetical protein
VSGTIAERLSPPPFPQPFSLNALAEVGAYAATDMNRNQT